ncbi:baseplate hub [Pectobacterium bacteriophage PM2]|uniref:Baseplate hub subunit n=1 Tax=Pectobacterium bacteriophage PM2 TaxID=1429794 RepID=A0A0A0Q3K4_9CAUD|nr:baseplate hub [Pectobacterium bacteriophage PM2]AHY25172.1 baseplate hub subunit [Pectobacterium bacteriophage PM2]
MNNQYKFAVFINNKEIECRAFTLREYKNLLIAKSEGRLEDAIKKLFKDCTNAKDLPKHEAELLLVKLWAHSLGEVNVERIWGCDCGKEIIVPINLIRAGIDSTDDLLYVFKDFKIQFKYPGIFEDKNKAVMVASCIEYIITNSGEQLKVDDLSDVELDDLYSAITNVDIDQISDMLTKPKIQLAIPIKCECGKDHIHVVSGLKEFFKLL